MIELTHEQRQELARAAMPRFLDPQTRKIYVLVGEDVYERLQGVRGDNFDPINAYPALDRTFAEGWDDPQMDDYDRYEELKQ